MPADLEVHFILDNYNTHKSAEVPELERPRAGVILERVHRAKKLNGDSTLEAISKPL